MKKGEVRVIKYGTCNYWEVPAHPTYMELLKYLIKDAAKIKKVKDALEIKNKAWRDKVKANGGFKPRKRKSYWDSFST